VFLLFLLLLAGASCGPSRSGTSLPLPEAPDEPTDPSVRLAALEDWINPREAPSASLFAGDTISIEIKGHAEYSLPSRVIPADGVIPLSGIPGGAVQAIGKTPQALEKEIAKLYDSLLVSPYVTVLVRGYATRAVYVFGEVHQSGKFTIPQDTGFSLIQAIAEAGGPTDQADRRSVHILRHDRETGRKRTSPAIDLDALLQAGRDIPLVANDTIQVPKRPDSSVAIWGKGVNEPGTYPWTADLTVSRLIPMAGGLTKFADLSKVLVLRRTPEGQKTFAVDLNRVYANREPDLLLRPGDVVRVDDTFF
jgi:protein involved in polysaccharide export with SLBB domain